MVDQGGRRSIRRAPVRVKRRSQPERMAQSKADKVSPVCNAFRQEVGRRTRKEGGLSSAFGVELRGKAGGSRGLLGGGTQRVSTLASRAGRSNRPSIQLLLSFGVLSGGGRALALLLHRYGRRVPAPKKSTGAADWPIVLAKGADRKRSSRTYANQSLDPNPCRT